MEKLIYITLAVPAGDAPESQAECDVAARVLVTAIGDQARIIDVSDEARVETIAQIVTAFNEMKRHVADIRLHLDQIQSGIPDMNFAFEKVSEAIRVLQPEPKN